MDSKLEDIIKGCCRQDRSAQKALYMRYVNTCFGICTRYVAEKADAEEIVNNAFLRIFRHIEKFDNKGSFDGWIKRIVANCCLTYIGKTEYTNRTKIVQLQNEHSEHRNFYGTALAVSENDSEEKHRRQYLLQLIQNLPENIKVVFNLYVFEDYNHKEIGELLNIAERTSQSYLAKAREILGEELDKNQLINKMQRV